MTAKERLIVYLEHIDMNPRSFEISIGAYNGLVSKINTSIKIEILERISKKYPDLNLEWLQIGTGEMLKNANPEFDSLEYDLVRTLLANPLMIEKFNDLKQEIEQIKLDIVTREADRETKILIEKKKNGTN